jgi:hypothetical protein
MYAPALCTRHYQVLDGIRISKEDLEQGKASPIAEIEADPDVLDRIVCTADTACCVRLSILDAEC